MSDCNAVDAADRGADGPASLARPSRVRAVQPASGHDVVSVRECLDVLAIDRLLARGLLTEAQHAAGLMVAAAWRAAGLDRRVTARPGGAAGGADDPPGWPAWRDLVERVPVRYQAVVVSVCGAGQMPTSPLALAALRAGLDALASRRC